ncbi:ATP-binding protein [Nocardia takedensis]
MGERNSLDALRIEFPAAAEQLAAVRGRTRDWLTRAALAPARASDLLLAVDEACANAIEHGHRDGHGLVRVQARLADGLIRVTVRDQGTWVARDGRPDATRGYPDSRRGRGLALMRALVPDTRVDITEHGTIVEFVVACPRIGEECAEVGEHAS